MTDLDKLFEAARDLAQTFFKNDGQVFPFWMAETQDGDKIGVSTPWDGPDAKATCVEVIRDLFAKHGVVRYAFLAEAWAVEARPEQYDLAGSMPLSQHPDRREVVSVLACDETETRAGQFYILRPEHGKASLSEFRQLPSGTQHTGRMSSLLPKQQRGTVH